MMTHPVRKGYVDTPGGQIHYRSSGAGAPLVLLHQNPSSSAMWEPLLPRLAARGVFAIALDAPGYGSSDRPAQQPDLDDYAARTVAAIRGLGLQRVDLMGHHTGATIAMAIAAGYPDMVRRLVLWGVPLMAPEQLARLAGEGPPTFDDEGEEVARYWRWRRRLAGADLSTESIIARTIEMLQAGSTRHWSHQVVGRADYRSLLERIMQPTLLLSGERDVLFGPTQAALPLLRNGQFQAIDGTGIDVADERPEELAEAVAEFLSQP